MLLLPWYQLTESSPPPGPQYFITTSLDGWHGLHHARWLVLAAVVAGLALFVLQATRRAPAVPVTLSLLTTVIGGLTVLWLIYRVVINPAGGRELGGWVGLIAACALTYGGFKSLQLEGISRTDGPGEIATVRLGQQGGT